MALRTSLVLAALVATARGDVYMHMMRGSNNRLKAAGVNTQNQNRLFNSQNNAKGGYNHIPDGPMEYYAGSELLLEWTQQHGCNSPKDECQVILQYMCKDGNPLIKDGTTESTPPEGGTTSSSYGQHESNKYYKDCKARQRNQGLFTADRRRFYSNNFYYAQYTRQNENGNRRGYECQEERDYYPYWHPTPWRDIAVLVDTNRWESMCPYYEAQSENTKGRGYCDKPMHNNKDACEEGRFYYPQHKSYMEYERTFRRHEADKVFYDLRIQQGDNSRDTANKLKQATDNYKRYMAGNKANHAKLAGSWKTYPSHSARDKKNVDTFRCRPLAPAADWKDVPETSRVNQLGNTPAGQPPSFLWKIPEPVGSNGAACVLRLRYNMSSSDYPMWRTWSEHNGDYSPIKQNQDVPVGVLGKVRLALNTNQVSRTFQDRSHVFKIKPRLGKVGGNRLINLNVRGKRGNIVQAYPAVEYDYHPNRMTICTGDWVHYQWGGSNTNPNNYAGQGTAGTDRSNIVQMGLSGWNRERGSENWQADNFQMNTPLSMDDLQNEKKQFTQSKAMFRTADEVKKFALLGQEDNLLNKAKSKFNYEPIQYKEVATYHYMCTRNNNFSNRSQKGQIDVKQCKKGDLPELHPGAVMADLDPKPHSAYAKAFPKPTQKP